jgi:outer membrane protein W
LSFEKMFAERLSLQAAVAYERHRSYPYVVEDDGSFTPVARRNLHTVPIDLTARYHWLNDTRWKPYLGLGAHYVAAPTADRRFRYQDHINGTVNGGVLFMFTPSVGALLDGRALLGDKGPYDTAFKLSAGLSWRF